MEMKVTGIDKGNQVNAMGDHVYKAFGTIRREDGTFLAASVHIDKGTHESMARALMEGARTDIDVRPSMVIALRMEFTPTLTGELEEVERVRKAGTR